MEKVAYDFQLYQPQGIDIIRHVDEKSEETRQADRVDVLEGIDGLNSAEHCPLRWHLLLIDYEREILNSQQVLTGVVVNTSHAE